MDTKALITQWTKDMPNPTSTMLERGVKTVIACTGRCGSTYLAKLLANSGLNATHEAYHRPVYHTMYNCKAKLARLVIGMEKPRDVESSIEISPFVAPFLKELPPETRVIHLVKNPIHVIRSWFKDGERWGFPYQQWWLNKLLGFDPIWPQEHQPWWYAEMFCRWNFLIEELSPNAELLRIEDMPDRTRDVFGVDVKDEPSRQTNSTGWTFDLGLGSIKDEDVRARTRAYMLKWGYDVTENPNQ